MWTVLLPLKESSGKHFSRSALRHTCGAKVCGRLLPLREHGTQEIKREASTSYQDRYLGSGKGKKKKGHGKGNGAKESEPCSAEMEPSRTEETHATQFEIRTNPVYYSKEVILVGERKWNDFSSYKSFKGESLQAEISKLVVRLVLRFDQDERETDGAVHWNSMGLKLRNAFQKSGGRKFSDVDWLQHIFQGSSKMRFKYCQNSPPNCFLYIRAIQGHTGGNLKALELMGHVAIPYKWKEFLFHSGCSLDVTSILTSGLIAGGRESKEGRQTIFFTPPNSFGDNPDEEEPGDDVPKPRTVHFHSQWKNTQDAVYWINLARAQDKGLRFWQTRSHAVIVYSSVPADCIYKVICQKRERTLFERLSTLRPAPKIVLQGAWQSQQQQQQQQQDTSESASSSTRKLVQNPTDSPELPSARKLERSTQSPVEKEGA